MKFALEIYDGEEWVRHGEEFSTSEAASDAGKSFEYFRVLKVEP